MLTSCQENAGDVVALDPFYTLITWKGQSKRLDKSAAREHVKDLNPMKHEVVVRFTQEWLKTKV